MLSELLDTFQLEARVYNNAQFCGNWRVKEHGIGQTCFHIVTVGRCQMKVKGSMANHVLELGDLVIFPRELEHHLTPFPEDVNMNNPMGLIKADDKSEGTAMLCGELRFGHKGFNYILDALPPYFIITAKQAPWIGPLLEQIRQEMIHTSMGSGSIIDRLSELLFVYALRHQISDQTDQGFLNLYSHPELSPAIKAIKKNPSHGWSIELLANECAMSRTKFAQLFKAVSKMTVNEYLTWWRMQLAYEALQKGKQVSLVAQDVGYQSDAAFGRVFKKAFGMSPSKVNK